METLLAPSRLATGQTSPQGRSAGAALGRPKKLMPAVMRWICPRRSSLNWQESMRNRYRLRKQMTTDARRLMRLRAVAQGSNRAFRLHSNKAKWFGGRIFLSTAPRVNPQAKSQGWPYEGLSRMKGNFHVRFLEGGGLATARLHSARRSAAVPSKSCVSSSLEHRTAADFFSPPVTGD